MCTLLLLLTVPFILIGFAYLGYRADQRSPIYRD